MSSHSDAAPGAFPALSAPTLSLRVLTLVFFVSGLSALIHETTWSHYLRLLVGHAALAQAISIISFMGGLAAGAFVASRYTARIRRPLLAYALIELAIGIYALSFHTVFAGSIELLHYSIAPALATAGGIHFLKLTWAFLLTFPVATLIGMTFPLMSTVFLRQNAAAPERSLGLLYFANSIGAAIGTLLCGFLLINLYGLPGAMLAAGAMNIAIALSAYFIASLSAAPSLPVDPIRNAKVRIERLFIITAFVTGATSFFYEIAWIRLLNLLLGTSDYSFELILSAYIMGIALGAKWLHSRHLRSGTMLQYLALIQLLMGLLATLSIVTYDMAFTAQEYLVDNLPRNFLGFSLYNGSSLLSSYAVVLPTTFMAGMTLPLLTALCIRRGAGEGAVGTIYGWNTVGAIIGVLAGTYVLMPQIGASQIIYLGAIGDVALGTVLLAHHYRTFVTKAVLVPALLAAVCFQWFYTQTNLDLVRLSSGVYRYGSLSLKDDNRLLYYRDGMTATVSVLLDSTGRMQLRTNGKTDAAAMRYGPATTQDEPTMTLMAAVPLALRPQSREIANIGFGSGMTTNALLSMPTVTRVDTIEIEPAVIEAARHFGKLSALAYEDPRSNIIIDDARSYFAASPRSYDLILSEPSNPWVSGVATIFSEQFYRLVNKSLKDDGLFVQWLHLYESNDAIVSSIFNALQQHFSDYLVFSSTDSDILIVAGKMPVPTAFSPAIFTNPRLAAILKRSNIVGPADLTVRVLGTKAMLEAYLQQPSVPTNSDYRPFVSRTAPYTFFTRASADLIPGLYHNPLRSITHPQGTATVSNIAEVTPSPYFAPARRPSTAKLAYRYFMEESPTEIGGNLTLLREMYYVRSALLECRRDLNASLLQHSLFETAVNTTPFLSPQDSRQFWHRLSAPKCQEALPHNVSLWLRLHAAIGQADLPAILTVGPPLLTLPNGDEEFNYLLGSVLAAYQGLDRTREALEVWHRVQASMAGRPVLPYLQNIVTELDRAELQGQPSE